jgi:hypothetical protein
LLDCCRVGDILAIPGSGTTRGAATRTRAAIIPEAA